ncbi:GyrI-like domain-containing protein [Ktedonobacter racemifer]|uniref:Transcriptional activator ligand binding domain protein n=1 Tax=Ktedonobacter racemifer DSM 44963 TaxID=485913 RepID=D6TR73_KTERA|nr:GyrI-like domain-containing protein [Ktedonobacter racemifer]EFH87772.1 transcriptional activator ligand binding domain protein [Ktedonobacter racemifer DSM 44963]
MITEPKLENRNEQRYVAIRTHTTMQELDTVIQQLRGEVFAWLGKRSVAPAGAPFLRNLVIDMEALLDIEVGIPVASVPSANDRVTAGVLPAGRYASLVYTGWGSGIEANAALLDWGAKQGLEWDAWETEQGRAFGARLMSFLTDPNEEPDQAKWETEVVIRLADPQPR